MLIFFADVNTVKQVGRERISHKISDWKGHCLSLQAGPVVLAEQSLAYRPCLRLPQIASHPLSPLRNCTLKFESCRGSSHSTLLVQLDFKLKSNLKIQVRHPQTAATQLPLRVHWQLRRKPTEMHWQPEPLIYRGATGPR